MNNSLNPSLTKEGGNRKQGAKTSVVDAPLFAKEGVGGVRGLSVINEYTEVIKHLSDFTEIDAVVTGGFHVETAKALKERGISYLTITPNVTKADNGNLYERVMAGKVTLKDFAISSLSPATENPEQLLGIVKVAMQEKNITPEMFMGLLSNGVKSFPEGTVQIVKSADGDVD